MKLTKAVLKRFWQSMGERFGKRWLEEYGMEPSRSWSDALDRYSPETIKAALDAMDKKGWQHPPTLSQFEPLLIESEVKSKTDPRNYTRDFWRGLIVYQAATELVNRKFITHPDDFELFLVLHKRTLAPPLLDLLNEVESLERQTMERTPGMFSFAQERARAIASSWIPAEAA